MFDANALLAGDENALSDAVDVLAPELYRYADAVYQLRVQGENSREIRSRIEAILDTVG